MKPGIEGLNPLDITNFYLFEGMGRNSQLWSAPDAGFSGKDAFVVSEDGPDRFSPKLAAAFQSLTWIARINNPARPQHPYHLYLGRQLTHWPGFFLDAHHEYANTAP